MTIVIELQNSVGCYGIPVLQVGLGEVIPRLPGKREEQGL